MDGPGRWRVSARAKGEGAALPLPPFDVLSVPLDPGVTLVEASAGTGKTFAITRLLLRLLLERKVDSLSRILVVTFTEKATQELVTRIRRVLHEAERVWSDSPPEPTGDNKDLFVLRDQHGALGREVVRQALGSLDDLAVSTIHGFCQRILSESALESRIPFRTTFIEDDTEPYGRAARDWARRRLLRDADAATLVVADGANLDKWVKGLVAPFRRQERTRLDWEPTSIEQGLLADFISTVSRAFEAEKVRRHLLGFDDLLTRLSTVLAEEGADGPLAHRIRARFGAALIDEFQDTDQTQFPIFSNAFHGCPLFLIGDPKQSIYRFRGADIHAYLRAARLAERRYTLMENYRSSAAYVQAVETLFTRASDPFLMPASEIGFPRVTAATEPKVPEGWRSGGDTAAMQWWWVDGSLGKKGGVVAKSHALTLVARDVTSEIVRLAGEGLPFGSVAVLVRKNDEARVIKAALDRARVPAVMAGDADVLQSEEADDLARLAAAIAAPHDARAVRSAMATRLWGSDAKEIAATLEVTGERRWSQLAERFAAARDLWHRHGVAVAFGELLAQSGASARLLALPDGERRMTNVRHVIELFHEAWAEEGIAPEGFAVWIARERTVPNTPGRRELRLESDDAAVQILTIHKSKGLQFDVVFCPTLWEVRSATDGPLGVTPALVASNDAAVLDLGSTRYGERLAEDEREEAAERLRLAYVALTRAVHRCYVAWGEIGSDKALAAKSPLGYLLRDGGDDVRRATLVALVANSGGTMSLRDVDGDGARVQAPARTAIETEVKALALSLAKEQLATWESTSFTALVGEIHGDEARDVADPLLLPDIPGERAPLAGFRAFPSGRLGGIALHDVFEGVDFRRIDDPRTREMVERTLARHGMAEVGGSGEAGDAGRTRVDDVMQMLTTVCNAPVPGASFALAQVPMRAGVREWRFDLSVNTASARRIADALAKHGSPHARAYAPRLRSLRDAAVGGYLTGVVDLAFEHEGRWWLVDWKSNDLGDTDLDYSPDALSNAMMQAHYTLQYHLYLLALHRHLQVRQPGYDPARHWGGVAYVFLRGVTGAGEAGWFRDTPTPGLLQALDVAMGRRS